jgi:hypothetical protein
LTIGLAADEIRDVDDVEAELTLTVVVGAVLGLNKTNKMSVINLAFTWLIKLNVALFTFSHKELK